MTWLQLRDEIAARINRTDLTSRITALAQDRIGYYRKELFYAAHVTDTSISTVVGTTFYNLPSGWIEVESVRLLNGSNWVPLVRSESYEDRLHADISSPAIQSLPYWWGTRAAQIWLFPTPSAVHTLELTMSKGPAMPVADGDINFWTQEEGGQSLIINATAAEIFRLYINDPVREARFASAEERESDMLEGKTLSTMAPMFIQPHD